MRIAYVAGMVPRRRELAPGPIDAEWIVDERGPTDVVAFVEYESEGTDLLRQAGVPVHVSAKRHVAFAEGGVESAEELQARVLLQLHIERPFDAILYDSSQTTDWAWHQPRLGPIPRGVVLGQGPIRDIRVATQAPGVFGAHGRKLWAHTGPLATADFLVSDVGADVYGLDQAALPVRYSLVGLPTTPPPAGVPAMLALVALSESPTGLATLVERTLRQATIDENTVIAIVHPDISIGPETTRDILLDSLPPHLQDRVRVAEPSSDGVAEGLLSQADVVVAARQSDLAVRAVADAAAKVGSMVLEGGGAEAPRMSEAALVKAPQGHSVLVPVDGPLEEIVPLIDDLADEVAAVVLHAPGAARLARRIWKLPGATRAGLIMVCDTDPYLGEADPSQPARNVLGFGMESWPSVRRLLRKAKTLHEVVTATADLGHAHRTNLLALPVVGAGQGRLSSPALKVPSWITDTGSLPQPNLAGAHDLGLAAHHNHSEASDIKQWAETHGIRERIRLALPWKWGMLNRAMRDRW